MLERFYSDYTKALEEGYAALFAGAGLSHTSGFVNWKELMRDIAKELHLDVDQETDLIAIAQYHENQFGGRGRLNQLLVDEFTKDAKPTKNHELIADLPLATIWTTNYDRLLEQAFERVYKRVDIKVNQDNLATTTPQRDVIIYKMHGDVSQSANAVLVKDDYERYERDRPLFSAMLQGDLISKTFLFLGFSFSDPNIDYILSRIRVLLGKNRREHYCVMRQPQKPKGKGRELAKFEYERAKLGHRIADLKRFGIQTLFVDDYAEVTQILTELKCRSHRKDVFVSGSAHEYQPLGRDRVEALSQLLGREIIRHGYNLISGLGLGVGAAVIVGSMEELYVNEQTRIKDRVNLRPFPQTIPCGMSKEEFYSRYREDMISNAGFVVFICGNKLNESSNAIVVADGVMEEFEITKKLGKYAIPIGASGYAAQKIWEEVAGNLKRYYPGKNVKAYFEVLNDDKRSNVEIAKAVLGIMQSISHK